MSRLYIAHWSRGGKSKVVNNFSVIRADLMRKRTAGLYKPTIWHNVSGIKMAEKELLDRN